MHGAGSCQGFSGGRSRGGAAGCERTHECVARQGGSRGPAPAGLQTPPSWAQGEATRSCLPLGTSQATLTSPSEAASSPLGPGDGCCPRSVTSLSLSVLQRFPTCAFGSAQGLLEPPLQPRPLPVPWGLSRSPRPLRGGNGVHFCRQLPPQMGPHPQTRVFCISPATGPGLFVPRHIPPIPPFPAAPTPPPRILHRPGS